MEEPIIRPAPATGTIDPTMVPVQEPTDHQTYHGAGLTQLGVRPTSKWDMWWENVGASFQDETAASLMSLYLGRKQEREYKGAKLTPEEANKRYPGLPEPFKDPVDPVLAQFAYNEFKRREAHRVWMGRGPDTGFLFDFSSGAAASMADPVNLALNAATGGLLSAMKVPMGLGVVAGESLFQDLAAESVVRSRLAGEQQPRTLGESALNVAAGTAGGVGTHYLFKALGSGSKALAARIKEKAEAAPPGRVKNTLIRLVKAHENGQKLNPAASLDAARPAPMARSATDPEASFAPIAHPSERQFFLPEHGEAGAPVRATDGLGGVVVIDSPSHARSMAAGDSPGSNGRVRTVDLDPEARFLDLDTPRTDPVVERVARALKSAGVAVELQEGVTLRDLLGSLKNADPDHITKAADLFRHEGIAGYREAIDIPSGKANVVHLLDHAKARTSEPIPINPDKIAEADPGRFDQLQAEQDAPENQRFYEPPTPRPDKLVDPEGKKLEPIELEGARARAELEELAKEDPDITRQLADIDALEKYDAGMAEVARAIMTTIELGDDYMLRVRQSLLEKGVAASEADLDALSREIEGIRRASRDSVDFGQRISAFLDADIVDWPAKRKLERTMNARKVAELYRLSIQAEGGRKSVVENFLDVLRGGGRRQGQAVNLSTHDMAGALETGWIVRMRQALGKNLKAAESGLLEREITQEMASLEAGGTSMASGNKQAFEIAKVYHDIKEELFSVKSGYSPFLEKTENYFYRQTHARESIQAAGKDQWIEDAYAAFGKKSFEGLEDAEIESRLREIYDSIVEGRYHSSIFDKEAGDYNLAFRLANKRSLKPADWAAFYEYNAKYGKNVHLTMSDMIRSASRDISVMSKFGTTPRANVQRVISILSRADAKLDAEFRARESDILDAMHVQTFAYNRPAEAIRARVVTGAQKVVTLARNGMQFLSSFQDFASAATAVSDIDGKSYLGNFVEIFGSYWKNFAKGSKDASEFAQEFGAFVEGALRNLHLEIGYAGGKQGALDKLLQIHSVVTLAERHRAAMTATMAESVSRRLAEYAETKWTDLPAETRGALVRYGIDENSHAILKHGVEEIGGRKYLTPERMRSELLRLVRTGGIQVGDAAPDVLEKLPKVIDRPQQSSYRKPGTGYYESRNAVVSPRTGEGSGDFGADLSPLPAYSPDAAAKVAATVHERFQAAGFNDIEAGVAATLHSTFFDTIGRLAGKDPFELFSTYNLKVERGRMQPGVGGYLQPYSKTRGMSILASRPATPMDKTVIHESAHFFLESLTDVHRMDGLDPTLKAELDRLYSWLGVKDGNVTVAAHEQFVNSFEAYLRTNKAPTTALEKLFATIRDWYRRAFESVRRGFAAIPVSLSKAERAPQDIENFYKKLMGGQGNAELHGPLGYMPETMSPDELYGNLGAGEVTRLPNNLTDLIMKTGAIINDQVAMATTSPGAKERSIMYGRQDINTWKGALWRAFWQFKSSTVKSFETMARSYYSNPEKPSGDLMKVGKFVALSMGLYALQKEARNAIEGKTPEDPATPEYALKALVASGAGSVLADTLMTELIESSSVRGMSSGLMRSAIPSLTYMTDAVSTTLEAGKSVVDENTKFPGGDAGRLLTTSIPFQNVFYAKALIHYYLLNSIREEFGPGFLGNLERSAQKKQGLLDDSQDYFMLRPSESNLWTQELYR